MSADEEIFKKPFDVVPSSQPEASKTHPEKLSKTSGGESIHAGGESVNDGGNEEQEIERRKLQ